MNKKHITTGLILTLVLAFGAASASAATKTVTIRVTGMTCGGCAASIEEALKGTDGIEDARVSFEKGEAWIRYDDQKITVARLRKVINGTGFKAAGVVYTAKGSAGRGKR